MKETSYQRLKRELAEERANTSRVLRAIWEAKAKVLGHPPGVSPFDDLEGAEETMPVTDALALSTIIMQLP